VCVCVFVVYVKARLFAISGFIWDEIGSDEWPQDLWDLDALVTLVVFEDAAYRALCRAKCRIEQMDELLL